MPRNPDVPCASCGQLIWRGPGSLPAGEAVCRDCQALGSKAPNPTKTRAWRVLRDQVVHEEPLCTLGFPGVCTVWSETADHIEPKVHRPDLVMDRANLRGACLACNRARGHTPNAALHLGWIASYAA